MRLGVFGDGRVAAVYGDESLDITEVLGLAVSGPEGPLHQLVLSGIDTAALPQQPLPGQKRLRTADLDWVAPLPRPGKIIGAPANYHDHVQEMVGSSTIMEWGCFLKANTSVIGPGGVIQLPYRDKRTDQEGELGVVIGRTARHVPVEHALDYVFGYTCVLDITVRATEDRSTRKSFDTFTPLGPELVTPDEFGDPAGHRIYAEVDGELLQEDDTAEMIFDVPTILAFVSDGVTLEPGDLILTGTPAGAGAFRTPPRYLQHGEVVTAGVEGIGELRNRFVHRSRLTA